MRYSMRPMPTLKHWVQRTGRALTIQRWLLLLATLGLLVVELVHHTPVVQLAVGLLLLTAVPWNRRGMYRR
jgi:hypothetical protein